MYVNNGYISQIPIVLKCFSYNISNLSVGSRKRGYKKNFSTVILALRPSVRVSTYLTFQDHNLG